MRTALLTLFLAFPLVAQQFDLVIAGGRVIDGSGDPWFYSDVGVKGDTITALGNLSSASAARRIDAKNLVVAPGFIDIHTHARRGIFATPAAENYIRQGVTTLMEGPDGSSPIPIAPFLKEVAAAHPAPNFGTFAGQGSIRQAVMELVNRPATPEEIEKQRQITRQAMLDGAFGVTTGLFYVPGNFTPTAEVIEIERVAGGMGGMHHSHMRDEAAGILDSVRETIRIGEDGYMPTQITHHKIIGKANWGKSVDTLLLVEEARARGVDVTIDEYPYTASSTGTASLIPQEFQEGGQKALVERLDAPSQRMRIKAAVIDRIVNDRGAGDPANVVMANCSWDHSLDGKNLTQITVSRGREGTIENAAETLMEIQHSGGCQAVYHSISEDDLQRILKYPFTMIGSDGEIPQFGVAAPHPRSYGTFVRVLGRYARDLHVITLEDAVHKMSGLPAQRLKLYDRGLIRPGMRADLAIFDPATVADTATFEKPHQYAVGVKYVAVNGKVVIDNGRLTAERPGRILYGPAFAGSAVPGSGQ
ncbi:MAG TPA: D-aminoacylase [Bryobacteraceae bacterium]|nr:D-aminoacylase [Bryobacteraceae bacterium]